ncbi:MAG: hypothetical protein ABSA34_00525 [Candidatus Goldiibacteriota bacterium]|jgi:hypothetical protein
MKKNSKSGKKKKPQEKYKIPGVLFFFRVWMITSAVIVLVSAVFITRYSLNPAKMEAARQLSGNYTNPELASVKELKPAYGTLEKNMAGLNILKFSISDTAVFGGVDPIFALTACCTSAGRPREYYTNRMPWELIMYKYDEELPTITVFDIDSVKKTGKFAIVILDPKASASNLKAVDVKIYEELLKAFMPGFSWSESARQEID